MQPDKRLITPSEVYTVFKKMSDSDLHLLGLSDEYARPEWMILTVMPVPPPPVRPSIAVDGGAMRSEDDLTYKLGDIIKASANVRRCEQEGAPAHVISEFEQLLQVRPSQSIPTSILTITTVPCRDIHGQRHRRHPTSPPKIRPSRKSHPCSSKRQRRPSSWKPHG